MAVQFTGTDTNGITLTANSDLWINTVNAIVSQTGADAFNFAATFGNKLLVQGLTACDGGDAITSDAGSSSLSVHVASTGVVFAESDAIELYGDNHTIVNEGSIHGVDDAAVQILGSSANIVNYGTMVGSRTVVLEDGTDHFLENYGSIASTSSAFAAIQCLGTGTVIVNSGTISGVRGVVFETVAAETSTLVNSGRITSAENAGLAVQCQAGDDTVFNTGVIEGTVTLGLGSDVYRGSRTGAVTGDIRGEEGDDRLVGGTDDDRLVGGAGIDRMKGGRGNDQFVFELIADSGLTEATRDVVVDFSIGDKIDILAIDANELVADDQAFALDKNNSFSIGEIRQKISGSNLLLQFNTDGEAGAEMTVLVLNHGLLKSGDFEL